MCAVGDAHALLTNSHQKRSDALYERDMSMSLLSSKHKTRNLLISISDSVGKERRYETFMIIICESHSSKSLDLFSHK